MNGAGGQKAREPRKPVRIGARLMGERGWSDVVIRNVSSGGVMGASPHPPVRGDYVEVRCGSYRIVARIAWARGGLFGAQARGRIEIADLLAGSEGRAVATDERRQQPQVRLAQRAPAPAEQAERSARAGRMFDFAMLALAGAAFAGLAASAAYQALAAPIELAAEALAGAERQTMLGN
ncbi:MAG: PilZ domain-containing protein [Croceibacterium sp.]